MGRKKIAIQRITDSRRRQVTFSRRRFGLMKKAYELSVLCNCDIGLIMFTPNEKLFLYSNRPMDDIIHKYGEFTQSEHPTEALQNADMLRLIERNKDGEFYDFYDEEMEECDEAEKKHRSPAKRPRAQKYDESAAVPMLPTGSGFPMPFPITYPPTSFMLPPAAASSASLNEHAPFHFSHTEQVASAHSSASNLYPGGSFFYFPYGWMGSGQNSANPINVVSGGSKEEGQQGESVQDLVESCKSKDIQLAEESKKSKCKTKSGDSDAQ